MAAAAAGEVVQAEVGVGVTEAAVAQEAEVLVLAVTLVEARREVVAAPPVLALQSLSLDLLTRILVAGTLRLRMG